LLEPIDAAGRNRFAEAMRDIRMALRDRDAESEEVNLRPLRPGDIGWIIHRQAVLYTQEYGGDWTYEGLASRILGAFVEEFDPAREDGWVAERAGAIVGSIFLMKSGNPAVAKLRLLYVEPSARGAGVGRVLVATCIARARGLGYRHLTLWTNDILVAARRIYQAAGFQLVDEAPHHSFGHDLVGQTWTLDLA
jgi:GNAT superfamily N-acetyltransferase